jgi:hypothetical protein
MKTMSGRDRRKNCWDLYKSLLRAGFEKISFLIRALSNSSKVLIEKIQLKALKRALGLQPSHH